MPNRTVSVHSSSSLSWILNDAPVPKSGFARLVTLRHAPSVEQNMADAPRGMTCSESSLPNRSGPPISSTRRSSIPGEPSSGGGSSHGQNGGVLHFVPPQSSLFQRYVLDAIHTGGWPAS